MVPAADELAVAPGTSGSLGANGSVPRGDGPRTALLVEAGVPLVVFSPRALCASSPLKEEVGGKKAGLSLPYNARCCRASNSRRPSSLIAAGLSDRSDLLPDISARRP